MKIEISDEQLKILIELINSSGFRGADIEKILKLKQALLNPIKE